MGIFTNDSYKEISAVIFSTTGTFGKAVVQSGVERYIRSTRFRTLDINHFIDYEGMNNEGIHTKKLGINHYLKTFRYFYNNNVVGADVELCHSSEYTETHFDGLHVYYNPNAEVPLEKSIFFPPEITQNFYDMATDSPVQNHPDRALVSRQLFEPSNANLRYIIKHWFPEYIGNL